MIVRALLVLSLVVVAGVTPAAHADHEEDATVYVITELESLGGTSSGGSGITNRGWIVGTSNMEGDEVSQATLWRHGSPLGLGTLGGPNSAVLWPVKGNQGIVVGIAETADLDPRGELWSCSYFFPSGSTGHVCRGFVWRHDEMTPLPTHGGTHGFATGANSNGQVVGWAETPFEDPTCNDPQVLGFLAALWDSRGNSIQKLLPLPVDSASSATAINTAGQVVGISGICANAVGGFSARHAVLWEDGEVTEIGDLGGDAWNTPMAINDLGTVVGFANKEGTVGDVFNERAFIWTEESGIEALRMLSGDVRSQALGLNNLGQVVGLSRGPAGLRAVLWADGEPTDLNLVAPGYEGRLLYANDINDAGVITGAAVSAETGDVVTFAAKPVARR